MQIPRDRTLLFVTSAAVGAGLTVAATVWHQPGLVFQVAGLVGGVAFWGLAIGALVGCPWRGVLIGFLSAASTLFSYLVLIGP
jgi:hypothetical protein